jgi:hypothetical protein
LGYNGYAPLPTQYAVHAYAHAEAIEAEQARAAAARDGQYLQQLQHRQGQQLRAAGSAQPQLPVFT